MSAQHGSHVIVLNADCDLACSEMLCVDRALFRYESVVKFEGQRHTRINISFLCSRHLASYITSAATVFANSYLVSRHMTAQGGIHGK